ncbi:unnamed protein product, partial [Brachionus calyciflorus]
NHEKPMLFVDQFIYYKNQTRPNGNVYWRCKEYFSSLKCPASLTTTGLNTEIISFSKKKRLQEHDKVNELNLQVIQMLDKCRKRARTEQNSIRQIYRSEVNNLIADTRDVENVAKTEDIPALPKIKSDISLTFDRFKLISSYKNFILYDTNDTDRIITFASKLQIEILSKSTRWHIDGTFKSCPNLYKQLFTVHALFEKEMYLCSFILLVNKTNDIYQKAFTELVSAAEDMGYTLQPKKIMSDFELAAIKAIRNVFTDCTIKGCYFHFIQCIWKNIQEKGLTTEYIKKRRKKEMVSKDCPNSLLDWDHKENIFTYDSITINNNNNHWILCNIENKNFHVYLYDSFLQQYSDLIPNLRLILNS